MIIYKFFLFLQLYIFKDKKSKKGKEKRDTKKEKKKKDFIFIRPYSRMTVSSSSSVDTWFSYYNFYTSILYIKYKILKQGLQKKG